MSDSENKHPQDNWVRKATRVAERKTQILKKSTEILKNNPNMSLEDIFEHNKRIEAALKAAEKDR